MCNHKPKTRNILKHLFINNDLLTCKYCNEPLIMKKEKVKSKYTIFLFAVYYLIIRLWILPEISNVFIHFLLTYLFLLIFALGTYIIANKKVFYKGSYTPISSKLIEKEKRVKCKHRIDFRNILKACFSSETFHCTHCNEKIKLYQQDIYNYLFNINIVLALELYISVRPYFPEAKSHIAMYLISNLIILLCYFILVLLLRVIVCLFGCYVSVDE